MKNKAYGFIVLFLLFGTTLIAGCFSDTENNPNASAGNEVDTNETSEPTINAAIDSTDLTPSVKSLFKKYPYLFEAYQKNPVSDPESFVVPTLSDIPMEIKEVNIHNMYLGTDVEVVYFGDDQRIKIIISGRSEVTPKIGKEVIQLNKNITGYFSDKNDEISLQWEVPIPNDEYVKWYSVALVTLDLNTIEKKENRFTKEDAIQIANSLINHLEV